MKNPPQILLLIGITVCTALGCSHALSAPAAAPAPAVDTPVLQPAPVLKVTAVPPGPAVVLPTVPPAAPPVPAGPPAPPDLLGATPGTDRTPQVASAVPAPTATVLPPALPAASSVTGTTSNAVAGEPTVGELVPLIVIDDVPLIDAVKNLARQAGLNFQIDPRVNALSNQPNVTIRFENVRAEDALDAVLDNYGLTLSQDAKTRIHRITVKDPKAAEPLISHVVQLKYANPTNMVAILKATLPKESQVLPDSRTSQLVVYTTEKELLNVDALVAKLDTPTPQVLIEAQIWETARAPESVKGIDWSGTLEAQRVSFGNGRSEASGTYQTANSPGTTTTPGGRTIPSQQSSSASGLNVSSFLPAAGSPGLGLNTARGFSPATAFLNADGLSAVISFLNKDTESEVVATPRAVTLDNQTANLSITRAFPIRSETPGSVNIPTTSQVGYSNVGTILIVTPRIAANDRIGLSVEPEVSNIDGFQTRQVNGSSVTDPIFAYRRISTHVMIPSGNTLVLGGLMSDTTTKSYTKVPILGDAPGIGLLFRKDSKARRKSNLLIFVTPSVIKDLDFQVAQGSSNSDFLQTKMKPKDAKDISSWDSGKPYDWTKNSTNVVTPMPPSTTPGRRVD